MTKEKRVPNQDGSPLRAGDSSSEGPDRQPGALDRREFIQRMSMGSLSVLAAAHAAGLAGCSSPGSGAQGPNIVLLLADDMGFSDLGCFGGEIRTPNLDRLAQGGLRFTHFHNGARCCPSRASLLTGLYPHQAGVGGMMRDQGLPGYRGDLNDTSVTLAEVLKGAGYGTYACGKWHVSRFIEAEGPKHNWPCQRGFDRFFGTITGAGSFFEPQTLTLDNDPVEELGDGFYYTDAIADHATRFLRDHGESKEGEPFFLYAAFTAPHWPLHAPAEAIDRSSGRFDKGWDQLRQERYDRMVEMGIVDPRWALTDRDERVSPWSQVEDEAWQLRRMEAYAAQVEIMDQGIGRIVAELERQDVLENTLILFLADNGGCAEELDTQGWFDYLLEGGERVARDHTLDGRPVLVGNFPTTMPGPDDTYQSYGIPWANLSNTPFRLYKSNTHEGGVATPLLAHWPAGIEGRGGLRHQTGHLIDIMATFVDVSGAVYPLSVGDRPVTPMEGLSLVPAFSNRPLDREGVFFEHEGSRAALVDQWKLVARGRDGPWELYDMDADRTETRDLASQYPEELSRLTSLWEDWALRTQVIPRPEV